MFSTRSGAAKLSLIVIVALVVFKVVVAWITGSLSISAQAIDSFLDLFSVLIMFFAIRIAAMPADAEHPFGHGKIEVIAAAVQAVLIIVAGGFVIYSAVRRIIEGTTITLAEAGIGVMLFSIVVSIFLSRHLIKVSRTTGSIALEASARNIAADVYSAAGVLVAMVIIRFTGFNIMDPVIAIGVALYILKTGYGVMRSSFAELVDVRLPELEQEAIVSCIQEHSAQLAGYHKIRTRKSGSQRFVEFHLLIPKNASLEEAHQWCYHLEADIESRLSDSSVTIHVEPCTTECENCYVVSCNVRQT